MTTTQERAGVEALTNLERRMALSKKLKEWFPHYRNCMELVRDAVSDIDAFEISALRQPQSRLTEEELWLVFSHEHGAYWRPKRCGYTVNTDDAGRYTYAEAKNICEGAGSRHRGGSPLEVVCPSPELIDRLTAAPAQQVTPVQSSRPSSGVQPIAEDVHNAGQAGGAAHAAQPQVTPDDILSLLYCFNYKLPGGFFKQLPHESLVQLRDAIMSLLASRGLVKGA